MKNNKTQNDWKNFVEEEEKEEDKEEERRRIIIRNIQKTLRM